MFHAKDKDLNSVVIVTVALEKLHGSNVFKILGENYFLSRITCSVKSSVKYRDRINVRHTKSQKLYSSSSLSQEAIRNCSVLKPENKRNPKENYSAERPKRTAGL